VDNSSIEYLAHGEEPLAPRAISASVITVDSMTEYNDLFCPSEDICQLPELFASLFATLFFIRQVLIREAELVKPNQFNVILIKVI